MSSESNSTSSLLLLGLIPSHLLKPEQIPRWRYGAESHTYMLLRDPANLNELNAYTHKYAIWRDNGTLTYVAPQGSYGWPAEEQRYLPLEPSQVPGFHIVGKTDDAVAETAAYFLSSVGPADKRSLPRLVIGSFDHTYDFRAAGTQSLKHIFDAASTDSVDLRGLTLSVKQSTLLATRPYPMKLQFRNCRFEDGGTAFVDALRTRDSSVGVLLFEDSFPMNGDNLKRLLQLEKIERLGLPRLQPELVFLPFSTRLALQYDLSSSVLTEDNLPSLNMVTDTLDLTVIHHESETFPTESMVRFFRRLAEFDNLVELKIRFKYWNDDDDDDEGDEHVQIPNCVVQELIRAALAHSNLNNLVLGDWHGCADWEQHLEAIFHGLKDHKGLRTLRVDVDEDHNEAFGPDYIYLRELLSYNRNISVMSSYGDSKHSDGSVIDELYSLNRFYRGSASLSVSPPSHRPSLVATALLESASNDLQRSALLLSNHVDVLYELVQFSGLDAGVDGTDSGPQAVRHSNRKRKR